MWICKQRNFLYFLAVGSLIVFYYKITNCQIKKSADDTKMDMEDERLIIFLKDNLTKPIPISNSTPVLSKRPADGHYSESDESKKVDKLLNGRTNGFFVECGAAEGEYISNSLFFELKRNWTGILVEANPIFFRKLEMKKRNAYAYNGCLSPTKKVETLSFVLSNFQSGLDQAFESQERRIAFKIDNLVKVNATCAPLYSLMLAVGRHKIDFFSLDTEGGELDILKTIPFDKLDIDVIIVEYLIDRGTKQQMDNKIAKLKAFFANLGTYKFIEIDRANVIFKKIYNA